MLLMPPSALAAAVSTCTATSSQWGPPLALAVPPFESSPSFPSWHTRNATVVLGVTAYLVVLGRRHLRSRLLVGSLVGVRAGHGPVPVWLGDHWLTDVIAGGWWAWPGSAPSSPPTG
jgi:membrane-associated phospholipid phosphatase